MMKDEMCMARLQHEAFLKAMEASARKADRLIAREKRHAGYHAAGLNGKRAVARRLRKAA